MSARYKFPSLERLQKEARVMLRRIRRGDSNSFQWLHKRLPALQPEEIKLKHILDAIGQTNGFPDWRSMVGLYSSSSPLGGFIGFSYTLVGNEKDPYEFRCFYASKLAKLFETKEERERSKKAPFIFEHLQTSHGHKKYRAALVSIWNQNDDHINDREENHFLCLNHVFVLPPETDIEDLTYRISAMDAYWFWLKKQAADPHSYLNLAAKAANERIMHNADDE